MTVLYRIRKKSYEDDRVSLVEDLAIYLHGINFEIARNFKEEIYVEGELDFFDVVDLKTEELRIPVIKKLVREGYMVYRALTHPDPAWYYINPEEETTARQKPLHSQL